MTVAIAAAGTGGHVYPALAVADELRGSLDVDDIVFLGGRRMEARVVPEAGYAFEGFDLPRLERRLSVSNVAIPWALRRAAAAMARVLGARSVRVVITMGGYVAVPAAIAARRLGIPLFVQEQNASPGIATRFAARHARRVFLGLPGKAETLPRSTLVGNPLRPAIDRFDRHAIREESRVRYGLDPDGLVVGILGGSLGARVLNVAAAEIASAVDPGTVLHITGTTPEAQAQRPGGSSVRLDREGDMQFFYGAVDLAVCRAGAMTVSELAATGTPSVLVPLRRVGQESNADAIASRGAAVVVGERDIESLADIVSHVSADRERLDSMSDAALGIARRGASRTIASAIREALDG